MHESNTHALLETLGQQVWNASRNEILIEMPYLAAALDALDHVMDLSTGSFGTDAVHIRYNPEHVLRMYALQPADLNRAYLHMLLHCLFRHMFHKPPEEENDGKSYGASFGDTVEGAYDAVTSAGEDADTRMLGTRTDTGAAAGEEIDSHVTAEEGAGDCGPAGLTGVYARAVREGTIARSERIGLEREAREDLWDLSCDIAVEALLDQMDAGCIARVTSQGREEWLAQLRERVHTLSAERIYAYLTHEGFPDDTEYARLVREFASDDHSFWRRLREDAGQSEQPPAPSDAATEDAPDVPEDMREADRPEDAALADMVSVRRTDEEWKKKAKRIEDEIESRGSEAGSDTGGLRWLLHVETAERRDYRDYLKHFKILREECHVDPDSFDYAYYAYGMEHYGNMPLIEENEYRETNGIEELVIAIDTSASCQKRLVQTFLNETAAILLQKEDFLSRVNIHVIECDNRVQKDIVIHDPEEMRQYADGFEMAGGYGTDYRPVFTYVEKLRQEHALENLKGLMYFTDGYGEYPKRATDYETVFVFPNSAGGREDVDDTHVPDWAVKLYIM